MNKLSTCNDCAGTIVLSLADHVVRGGLTFCCAACARAFFSEDNLEPYPVSLAEELGVEEGGN